MADECLELLEFIREKTHSYCGDTVLLASPDASRKLIAEADFGSSSEPCDFLQEYF